MGPDRRITAELERGVQEKNRSLIHTVFCELSERILSITSTSGLGLGSAIEPQLFVACAEAALQLKDTDTAKQAIDVFFLCRPGEDQFFARAYLAKAQICFLENSSLRDEVLERNIESSLKYVDRALSVARKDAALYAFLVYNASVHAWRLARPLLRTNSVALDRIAPIIGSIVPALREALPKLSQEAVSRGSGKMERSFSWWVSQMLLLHSRVLDRCGKTDDAVKAATEAIEIAEKANFSLRYIGQLSSNAIFVARNSPPALQKLGATAGKPSYIQMLLLAESCLHNEAKAKDAQACEKDLSTAKQLGEEELAKALAGETKTSVPEICDALIVVGQTALKVGLAAFASDVLSKVNEVVNEEMELLGKAARGEAGKRKASNNAEVVRSQARLEVALAVLKLDEQSRRPETIFSKGVISSRLETIRKLEKSVASCLRLFRAARDAEEVAYSHCLSQSREVSSGLKVGGWGWEEADSSNSSAEVISELCYGLWNVALPLLQAQFRPNVKKTLNSVCSALADIQSLDHELRALVHLEAAKCELEEDLCASATGHVEHALALDYGVHSKEQGSGSPRDGRYLDRYLLPLGRRLRLKMNIYSEPDRPEEKALLVLEQAKEARDPSLKRNLLSRVVSTLRGQEELETESDQNNSSRVTKVGYTNDFGETVPSKEEVNVQRKKDGDISVEEERCHLWAEVCKYAWQAKTFSIVEDAAMKVHEYAELTLTQFSAEENEKSVQLQLARAKKDVRMDQIVASFIEGEMAYAKLRRQGWSVLDAVEDPRLHNRSLNDEAKELQAMMVKCFLQGLTYAVEVGESWAVNNAAVYLWNYHLPLFKSKVFRPLVEALRQAFKAAKACDACNNTEMITSLAFALASGLLQTFHDSQENVAVAGNFSSNAELTEAEDVCVQGMQGAGPMQKKLLVPLLMKVRSLRGTLNSSNPPSDKQSLEAGLNLSGMESEGLAMASLSLLEMEVIKESAKEAEGTKEGTESPIKRGKSAGRKKTPSVGQARQVHVKNAWDQLQKAKPNVELCAKLAEASLNAKFPSMCLEAAERATEAMKSLKDVSPAVRRWEAMAQCLAGRAKLALKEDPMNAAKKFLACCQLGSLSGPVDGPVLVETGAKWLWNCVLPLATTAPNRRQIKPLLRDALKSYTRVAKVSLQYLCFDLAAVLTCEKTIGQSKGRASEGSMAVWPGDGQFIVDFTLLLLDCLMEANEWSEGLEMTNEAFGLLDSSLHKELWEARIKCQGNMGKDTAGDMLRVKEYDAEMQARVWATLARARMEAVRSQAPRKKAAADKTGNTQVLDAYNKALDILGKQPMERAQYLVSFGQWIANENLAWEDAKDAFISAVDYLVEIDVLSKKPSAAMKPAYRLLAATGRQSPMSDSLTVVSQSIGATQERAESRYSAGVPSRHLAPTAKSTRSVTSKMSMLSDTSESRRPSAAAGSKHEAKVRELGVGHLEVVFRSFVSMMFCERTKLEALDAAMAACAYVLRIFEIATEAANSVASNDEKEVFSVPTNIRDWLEFRFSDDFFQSMREAEESQKFAIKAISATTIPAPEQTVYYCQLLAKELQESLFSPIHAMPVLLLAEIITEHIIGPRELETRESNMDGDLADKSGLPANLMVSLLRLQQAKVLEQVGCTALSGKRAALVNPLKYDPSLRSPPSSHPKFPVDPVDPKAPLPFIACSASLPHLRPLSPRDAWLSCGRAMIHDGVLAKGKVFAGASLLEAQIHEDVEAACEALLCLAEAALLEGNALRSASLTRRAEQIAVGVCNKKDNSTGQKSSSANIALPASFWCKAAVLYATALKEEGDYAGAKEHLLEVMRAMQERAAETTIMSSSLNALVAQLKITLCEITLEHVDAVIAEEEQNNKGRSSSVGLSERALDLLATVMEETASAVRVAEESGRIDALCSAVFFRTKTSISLLMGNLPVIFLTLPCRVEPSQRQRTLLDLESGLIKTTEELAKWEHALSTYYLAPITDSHVSFPSSRTTARLFSLRAKLLTLLAREETLEPYALRPATPVPDFPRRAEADSKKRQEESSLQLPTGRGVAPSAWTQKNEEASDGDAEQVPDEIVEDYLYELRPDASKPSPPSREEIALELLGVSLGRVGGEDSSAISSEVAAASSEERAEALLGLGRNERRFALRRFTVAQLLAMWQTLLDNAPSTVAPAALEGKDEKKKGKKDPATATASDVEVTEAKPFSFPTEEAEVRRKRAVAFFRAALAEASARELHSSVEEALLQLLEVDGVAEPGTAVDLLTQLTSVRLRRAFTEVFEKSALSGSSEKVVLSQRRWLLKENICSHVNSVQLRKRTEFLKERSPFWRAVSATCSTDDIVSTLPPDVAVLVLQTWKDHDMCTTGSAATKGRWKGLDPGRKKLLTAYASLLVKDPRRWKVARVELDEGDFDLITARMSALHGRTERRALGVVTEGPLDRFAENDDEVFREAVAMTSDLLSVVTTLLGTVQSSIEAGSDGDVVIREVVIIADERLSPLPLEVIPVMGRFTAVSRDFSVPLLLDHLKKWSEPLPLSEGRYIIDPLNDDQVVSHGEVPIQRTASVSLRLPDPSDKKAPPSKLSGVLGGDHVPSTGEWQRLIGASQALIFCGYGPLVASLATERMAALDLTKMKAAVILDRCDSADTRRRREKREIDKSPAQKAMEAPERIAALLASRGAATILVNGRTLTHEEYKAQMESLLASLMSGVGLSEAVQRWRFPDAASLIQKAEQAASEEANELEESLSNAKTERIAETESEKENGALSDEEKAAIEEEFANERKRQLAEIEERKKERIIRDLHLSSSFSRFSALLFGPGGSGWT